MRLFLKRQMWVVLLLMAGLVFSCQKEHITNPVLTIEDEKALGDKLAQLIKTTPENYLVLNKSVYTEQYDYLDNVMRSLVNTQPVQAIGHSNEDKNFKWEIFILLNDNKHNVITLPGGKIFVYSGLLKFIENEAELGGILAHEIGYTDRSSKIGDFALSPITSRIKSGLVDDGNGTDFLLDIVNNDNIANAYEILNRIESLAFDVNIVMNSDAIAVNILCEFLWDANGLRRILEKIQNQGISNFEWLITRPPSLTDELSLRVDKLEDLSSECGEDGETYAARYYQKILSKLP